MKSKTNSLVIIRGNSGCGKSTIARELRQCLVERDVKAALVEQDYLRRIVLKEKDRVGGDNIDLIEQTVLFALSKGYSVVLEGILASSRYGSMLERLSKECERTYVYYMDIPFEETLKRHATKHNSHEFGEAEMRKWWHEQDLTHLPTEKVIPAGSTVAQSVELILKDIYMKDNAG